MPGMAGRTPWQLQVWGLFPLFHLCSFYFFQLGGPSETFLRAELPHQLVLNAIPTSPWFSTLHFRPEAVSVVSEHVKLLLLSCLVDTGLSPAVLKMMVSLVELRSRSDDPRGEHELPICQQ